MIPKELIKQIRTVEIRSKKTVDTLFAGNFKSVFKGRGLEFEGIRTYERGDDYRSIDWKVTARMRRPYVKMYREEREMVVMILMDVSRSSIFGSTGQNKRELAAEFAATIALSAVSNNDQVGLLMFSDKIEKFIPPKKGKTHALRILREVLLFEPESLKTDIYSCLSFFNRIIKHKTVAFLVSDFIDENPKLEKMLSVTNLHHDIIAISLNDELDVLPYDVGLIELSDLETGETFTIDTSNKKLVDEYKKLYIKTKKERENLFKKMNIDFIDISTKLPIQKPLIAFFKKRERAVYFK